MDEWPQGLSHECEDVCKEVNHAEEFIKRGYVTEVNTLTAILED